MAAALKAMCAPNRLAAEFIHRRDAEGAEEYMRFRFSLRISANLCVLCVSAVKAVYAAFARASRSTRPATARTLRGAASQTAAVDSTLMLAQIQKAGA